MNKPKKQAFTLVELIIVVTILAILATIAFMSFQGYTSKTRDSKRVSELKNIEKGLQIYQTQTGKYPIPDDKIISSYSGTQLIYSGKINKELQQIIKLSELPKDPVNQELYNYGTSKDGKYYQLSSILENEISYNPLIETAYANSQSGYLSYVIGNYKGIYKDGTTIYNVPSLLIKSTTDTTIDTTTKFIIKNQTNDGVDTQTALKELTGSGGITLTGVSIPTDWNTSSGSVSQTLGYGVDEIGLIIYGDKYLAGDTTTPTNTQVIDNTPKNFNINYLFESLNDTIKFSVLNSNKNPNVNSDNIKLYTTDGYITLKSLTSLNLNNKKIDDIKFGIKQNIHYGTLSYGGWGYLSTMTLSQTNKSISFTIDRNGSSGWSYQGSTCIGKYGNLINLNSCGYGLNFIVRINDGIIDKSFSYSILGQNLPSELSGLTMAKIFSTIDFKNNKFIFEIYNENELKKTITIPYDLSIFNLGDFSELTPYYRASNSDMPYSGAQYYPISININGVDK